MILMWYSLFAFYCASLMCVVYATVLVVEGRHVESVAFNAAIAGKRPYPLVQTGDGKPRHRAPFLTPRGGDQNSARAICARVAEELAGQGESATPGELREIGLDDTDRLFTHSAMLELTR